MKNNRTHKRIIASVLALGVVISNAAGIIDGTNIFTNNSITASAADVDYDAMVTDIVNSITNDSMTEYQKMSAICKWIAANTNYSEGGMSYEYILENKVGNCVAHTELVNIMAKKAGLQCWCRYAGGISKGMHRNNMALLDGNYYEIETSYSGDYWGDASVIKKRDSLFTISTVSGETDATLISYDENFPEEFTIPSTVKGYNIKTIFDDFSGGSAHIAEYMVGDDRQQWGVKTLNISEGITTINKNAFTKLSKMETINIPSTVSNIDPSALDGCMTLKNLNIDSKNTKYSVKDGFLIENGNRIIHGYGFKPTNIIIVPDGITSIANLSLYCDSTGYTRCDYYIPASVTNIENRIWSSYSDRIYGVPGSYAEEYAKANNLTFIDSSHIHSYKTEVVAPTLYTEGYTRHYCDCGDEYKTDIVPKLEGIDISKWTVKLSQTEYAYTGTEKKPVVSITNGTDTYSSSYYFNVSYSNNIDAGTATVTVTGKESAKTYGTATATFKITPIDISSIYSATLNNTSFVFDGSNKIPTAAVKRTSYVLGAPATLTADTQYTVTATNNRNIGTATATITGKGNFTGSISKTFSITQNTMSNSTVTLSQTSYSYDGTAKKPAVTVKIGSNTLVEGTDYTVSYSNNTNAGTASVVVTGKNNLTGSVTKNFTITSAPTTTTNISTCTATLSSSSYTYDGTAKTPDITVKNGSTTLKEDTDYTVSYSNNVNAGTATAKITGKGSYTGTLSKTYTINKASIGTGTMTLSQYSYEYDGAEKKPDVTVKVGSKTLVNGTDYTVTYASNKNTGAATVTATGKGNYSGSMNDTFYITEPEIPEDPEDPKPAVTNISTCTATLSATSYTYDGTAKTPAVTVKNGTTTLTNGTDYTVTYSNNTNAGTATVTITGKGSYTGSSTKTFTIEAASISSATVTLSATSYNYDGLVKKPTVTVKVGDKTLVNGTDYSVVYSNSINAGTAVVKVTGKGNYSGTASKDYTINALSISSATVTLSATSYIYDGSAKKPAVTVKLNGKTLTSGTDYSVIYSNNKNIGTATVKVTGKGNYKFTATKTFTINPAKVTGIKTSTINKNSIKLTWNKVNGAGGYILYRYNNSTSKWVKVGKFNTTYATASGLSAGTTYRFKVLAYKTVNGKDIRSKIFTSFYTSTIPATVSFTVKSNAKNKATLKWSKVTGATNYIVYYKTTKNGSWKKLKTLSNSKTSYTKSGLTSGKTYYFTVKAVKKYNSKNYNSKITTKSVKIK